jgi:hypothetical protein
MFNEKSILKTVPFEQTDAMKEGDRVHRLIDARIKGTALPPEYVHLEPLVQSVERAPGRTFGEEKMTLNTKLQPCGWFQKGEDPAWVRIIVDVMKINGDRGFMGDWKTGKVKFDEHQLKLFAAVGFIYYPSVNQWTTAYIWLKNKLVDPKVYTRADLPQMWRELLQEPVRLQDYANRNYWPEKPGNHCKWCGVNKQMRCRSASEPYRGN